MTHTHLKRRLQAVERRRYRNGIVGGPTEVDQFVADLAGQVAEYEPGSWQHTYIASLFDEANSKGTKP